MARQHPAHNAVNALTRQHRMTIQITPTVRYTVTAPCLLAQLRDDLATSSSGTGGREIPRSRILLAEDAWDLWTEIHHSTHTWADTLGLDRRYRDDGHPIPPVGRLLRLTTATATGRGLDQVADAIARSANRWRAQIQAMLHGIQEQRGVRGAECPACAADSVVEQRPDGRYRVPAIVLVQRAVAGNPLCWLACLACGWSRGLADLATTAGVEA